MPQFIRLNHNADVNDIYTFILATILTSKCFLYNQAFGLNYICAWIVLHWGSNQLSQYNSMMCIRWSWQHLNYKNVISITIPAQSTALIHVRKICELHNTKLDESTSHAITIQQVMLDLHTNLHQMYLCNKTYMQAEGCCEGRYIVTRVVMK